MIFKNPAVRLSIALVLVSVNLLFMAKVIGFIPDENSTTVEMRKKLSESLALQFSAAAEKKDYNLIQRTLNAVVERNEDIRSAAIRTSEGQLIAMAGEHLAQWTPPQDGKSTPTHVNVPLFRKNIKWADVEIRFAPLWSKNLISEFTSSFTGMLLCFTLICFVIYFFILKKTLRQLDPSSVIPNRVQTAFDALKEGVLILDPNEHIVMANTAFSDILGKSPNKIIGLKGSELGWLDYQTHEHLSQLPWARVLKKNTAQENASLKLIDNHGNKIKLYANATMISGSDGNSQGVLVTFDDITELEEKNLELNTMVERLQIASEEIQHKNEELKTLANHDPLTLCLNRRSLSLKFDELFTIANREGYDLSCMMVDIDFFKSVNDNYGHSTGDQVIKAIADILKTSTRDTDLIGRYGGEEFVVVLSHLNLDKAAQIADRIRKVIESKSCSGVNVTVSIGVSSMDSNPGKPSELIDQADKALYTAKESGRNRVVIWGDDFKTVSENDVALKDKKKASTAKIADKNGQKTHDTSTLTTRISELEELLTKRTLELEHYKLYDYKTGLPTRSLFEDRIHHEITRAQRLNTMVAVLSVSVETIKRIHGTLGHKASIQLVKACGKRLNEILRNNIDTVAMVKNIGDLSSVSLINETEFGIVLTDIHQSDHVTWIMKRMIDSFQSPFILNDTEIYVSPYFGVSIFPHDGQTVEKLHQNATNACHFAKTINTKDRYLFTSNQLNQKAIQHLKIESLLHDIVTRNELALHYQPKINSSTGEIDGFEALIRWTSPDLGFVPPDQFIPIAEQSGQIAEIGSWVIYRACQQFREWLDSGVDAGSIAVNLSGLQLNQKKLPGEIKEILKKFDIKTHQLEIELTESSFLNTDDKTFNTLKQIKDMGLKVSMDDFGTGYSSLAYLRDIPLNALKIDKSFIFNMDKTENATKLIESIVSIAHSLDLEVVAEGVEEKFQADHLTAIGCTYLQGYYFSRPVPADEVIDLIKESNIKDEKMTGTV